LKSGDRVIGALDVQSNAGSAFDKDDVHVLQTMADQLAVAIENARLFQEMEQALHQLEVSQSLVTKGAWQGFIQHTGRSIGYHSSGLRVEPVLEQLPETAEAVREGKSIVKQDSTGGTSLVVPIKIRDEVLGVLNVRFDGGILPDEALSTYEEIANRLSLALESARLLEETQLRSEQLNLLQEITAAAASHINVQDLLEDISQRMLAGFDLRYCSAFLFDGELHIATCVSDVSKDPGTPEAAIKGLRIRLNDNPAFQQVIRSQKTTAFYDSQNNLDTGVLHESMKTRGSQTWIIAPLLSRGAIIGVISMELDDPQRHISKEDQQLLDQISLQVSVAMDVARLFEKTEQRAERERLISDITAKVRASTNVDIILQTSVKELAQALRIPRGAVHLKGENGGGSDE
jgi:GAF domain-containing protein